MLRSGTAPISSPMNARTPSGASTSTWPRTFSRPPSAHSETACSSVARVDRLEVAPRDRLGLVPRDAFARRRRLLHVRGDLLHLRARLACALPIGHAASFTPLNES